MKNLPVAADNSGTNRRKDYSFKNILYSCGFRNPTDFLCQEGDKVIDPEDSEAIKNVRPDTLIRMEDSWLVVDSKSLDNWKIG